MMLIFGVFIVIGAAIDILLVSFSYNHAVLIACGIILIMVNIAGSKLRFLRGIGKSIISFIILALAVYTLTGFSFKREVTDRETNKAIIESEKILAEEGHEKALEFLQNKRNEHWNKNIAYKIGEIYTENKNYNEAANSYYDVVRNIPEDIEARIKLAEALILRNDQNGAIREAEYVIKLDPECADAYEVLGDCYRDKEDHFREIYYYKIAADLEENSVSKRVKLAEAYGNIHSYEQSREHYEKAKEIASDFDEENMVYESYLRVVESENNQEEEQGGV